MLPRLTESAMLTLVGMLVVFIVLTILMLAIMVLSRVAPAREETKEGTAPQVAEPEAADKQAVAAIAVALAQAMQESEPAATEQAVAAPEPPAGASPWAVSGREQLMRSRGGAGRRWERLSK